MARIALVDHRQGNAQYGVPQDEAERAKFFGNLQVGSSTGLTPGQTWQHYGAEGWGIEGPGSTPSTTPGNRVTAPPLQAAPTGGQTPPPPAPTAATGQTSTTPAPASGQPQQTIQGAFQRALVDRLNQNTAPTSVAADPALAAQSGAFRQAAARGEARNRNALAERAAATGTLESGGFDAGVQQLGADRAFQEAQFDAGLLGQERDRRMADLQAALLLAGNTLSNDERTRLQMELTELQRQQQADAARLGGRELDIRERGITEQSALGRGDLDLRRYLGDVQGNLGLLDLLLSDRNTRTGQGINLALGQAGLNADAVRALLGG